LYRLCAGGRELQLPSADEVLFSEYTVPVALLKRNT
jgi:hypothetical protein